MTEVKRGMRNELLKDVRKLVMIVRRNVIKVCEVDKVIKIYFG